MTSPSLPRRQLFTAVAAVAAGSSMTAQAQTRPPADASGAPHKIVYQFNKHEHDHQEAVLNSIGAMLTKYVDDVTIAVVAWGPGLHLFAKKPKRKVSKVHQQRVRGMAQSYGVKFIVCGNTMKSLGWGPADMVDFVTVEDVGAAAMMELQEKGYAYLAW
ncbi:MAG: DsrE family protein [Gammaproteobacteria bacterium]|jgi:intracellular sulfur oxidation DsrE/DsrF family protein|nr:DsrE family protein [Gammaproteobacteria bacterium]MBU0788833.1 DsrE family protein [Gammaproteobacteria bacterium]MBU0817215.1 DsrE family protein [Gammaproteobacteria bacterium]MBU1787277.1 DsrE family protein [Gammaproteobacteria bacterium]